MESYGGPEHRGSVLNTVAWVMAGTATVTTVLRLYGRKMTNNIGLDDYFMIVAEIILLATTIGISLAVKKGFGRHLYTMAKDEQPDAIRMQVIMTSLLVWCFSPPKLAIVALLRRVVSGQALVIAFLYALCIVCLLFSAILSVLWYVQCDPVIKTWYHDIPGDCGRQIVLYYTSIAGASYSAILDAIFAAYPIWIIAHLQMPTARKIGPCVALGLGFFAAVITAYKATTFGGIEAITGPDPTYEGMPMVLWTILEGSFLVIAANIPTFGPLWRYLKESNLFKCAKLRKFRFTKQKQPETQIRRGGLALTTSKSSGTSKSSKASKQTIGRIRTNRRAGKACDLCDINIDDVENGIVSPQCGYFYEIESGGPTPNQDFEDDGSQGDLSQGIIMTVEYGYEYEERDDSAIDVDVSTDTLHDEWEIERLKRPASKNERMSRTF